MCGIVGYIGSRNAYDILIKGLHRLEYRGYDSAGVALINPEEKLNVYKAKGKVSDLENAAKNQDLTGTIGIAHTRWATHGEPSVRNAHPHVSESGNIAIVHNGIIENYSELREQLKEEDSTSRATPTPRFSSSSSSMLWTNTTPTSRSRYAMHCENASVLTP